jgi:hypothetical protein
MPRMRTTDGVTCIPCRSGTSVGGALPLRKRCVIIYSTTVASQGHIDPRPPPSPIVLSRCRVAALTPDYWPSIFNLSLNSYWQGTLYINSSERNSFKQLWCRTTANGSIGVWLGVTGLF